MTIEEKGREPYVINNYANCCITSNNDWLVSVGRDDRRFVLIECKNEKLTKEKISAIIKTDIQELANFFIIGTYRVSMLLYIREPISTKTRSS